MRKLLVLFALGVVAAGLLVTTGSATASAACGAQAPHEGINHFGAAISALAVASTGSCAVHNTGDPFSNGTPPLLYWGGPVMANSTSNPMTVTPIFWNPGGPSHYTMDGQYRDVLRRYLDDVARASGQNTNVFSVATEYAGSNGTIGNAITLGKPIDDHSPLPPSGCLVAPADGSGIYADGSGYTACLDDAQETAEIQRLIDARNLPQNDYSHIYLIYLPKHVESCFNPGDTTSRAGGQGCTINYEPTAAYCAYHSMMGNNWPVFGTIYGIMPYPIYGSGTHFTCGSDARGALGGVQAPNHNPDADTEVSPTSHEMIEAITDPNVYNGWYDSSGFEIGDDCAYVYGSVAGPAGREYNQVINHHQYVTQEEFSNLDFAATGGGCVPSEAAAG